MAPSKVFSRHSGITARAWLASAKYDLAASLVLSAKPWAVISAMIWSYRTGCRLTSVSSWVVIRRMSSGSDSR